MGLDVGDERILSEHGHRCVWEARRKTLERAGVGVQQHSTSRSYERLGEADWVGDRVLKHYDVLPGDHAGSVVARPWLQWGRGVPACHEENDKRDCPRG